MSVSITSIKGQWHIPGACMGANQIEISVEGLMNMNEHMAYDLLCVCSWHVTVCVSPVKILNMYSGNPRNL